MNKFGLVLVSYPYSAERVGLINRSITSLAKTNVKDLDCILQITYKETPFLPFKSYEEILYTTFTVKLLPDAELKGVHGQSNLSNESAKTLLASDKDVTHIVFLYDDWVYNPEWLQELQLLIDRHEDGIAFSVYRSRYTYHHQIVENDGTDTLMTMHDGVGCVTREEWLEYNKMLCGAWDAPDFMVKNVLVHGGCTFDIHHAAARPGNRWATGKDYIENIGRHQHIHSVDCAVDFVGE